MLKSNSMAVDLDEKHEDGPPSKREWYKSSTTGDRGWLVKREVDGKEKSFIKLDRPMRETLLPFTKTQWLPVGEYRPMTRQQLAQVAFEADKKLCFFLGKQHRSRTDWASLSDEDRIEFVKNGPPGADRQRLFKANMKALGGLSGER